MAIIRYNERSWAIDVITEINLYLHNRDWYIKEAGGENTINSEGISLFPDVLLFHDRARDIIIHGWELKMPDTDINDRTLINNAIKKASILQRDSFLLWNVRSAVLYCKQDNSFSIQHSWNDIDINNRQEVRQKADLWKSLLHSILSDLNDYFNSGVIVQRLPPVILSIDVIIDVILENIPSTSENLRRNIQNDPILEAQIYNWWLSSATEYGFNPLRDTTNKLPTLSKIILTDWVFKIIFANVLRGYFDCANTISNINNQTSIFEAKNIIRNISNQCDFLNIFSENLALEYISDSAWTQIKQINQFLLSINIAGIQIEILHNLLQSSIASARRKVSGQFATPKVLADLLVRLTIENKRGIVLDPCCGTGTIINQAASLKEEYDINQEDIINSIWASDKHSFPIQLSTLTLARPINIGKVLHVFSADVINLTIGLEIPFKDPNNGNTVIERLPEIDYVVSNLPFIKSAEIQVLNPDILEINNYISNSAQTDITLSRRSDIFAYIPFYLHRLLSDRGRIGIILSNAWLGTDYGEIFIKLIQKFFDIEKVIISGKGRWFNNADIVTSLLIARKRNPLTQINPNRQISFCTLKENINNIPDVQQLSNNILLHESNELVTIQNYFVHELADFNTIGIPWCSYFAKLDWIQSISTKLINCNQIFDFTRGERRGWNSLFYPAEGHNIEAEYIRPVLKNLRNTPGLFCIPNEDAFCCSKSIQELEQLNHTGALNWIRSFENNNNQKGIPLPRVLIRQNLFWYEMSSENMADFVANVNYDKSLFIAAFNQRTFIDQRMIGLSIRPQYNNENKILLLALLNSIISMFFIESFGFGRGLGALDLRATKFEKDFKILNFTLLRDQQKVDIINAFQPIANRYRFPLEEELIQHDRINFENTLFSIFGINEFYLSIKESLTHLYRIRFAVNN